MNRGNVGFVYDQQRWGVEGNSLAQFEMVLDEFLCLIERLFKGLLQP